MQSIDQRCKRDRPEFHCLILPFFLWLRNQPMNNIHCRHQNSTMHLHLQNNRCLLPHWYIHMVPTKHHKDLPIKDNWILYGKWRLLETIRHRDLPIRCDWILHGKWSFKVIVPCIAKTNKGHKCQIKRLLTSSGGDLDRKYYQHQS